MKYYCMDDDALVVVDCRGCSGVEKVRTQLERTSVSEPPVYLTEKIAPGSRAYESLDVVTNLSLSGSQNKVFDDLPNFVKTSEAIFGDVHSLIYDRASILYSLRQLPFPKASDDQEQRVAFFLNPNELPEDMVAEDCVKIHVKPCKEDFHLSMKDLKSGVSNNPDEINRNLQQFLEILTMQEVFLWSKGRFISYGSGECYLLEPDQFGFGERDVPELREGKYVAVGASKGVRIIEGPQEGGMNAALIIDVKKAAFHIDNQSLLEKIEHILGKGRGDLMRGIDQQSIAILNKALKGLYVLCNYGKKRAFMVAGISKKNARTSNYAVGYGTVPTKNNFYPIEVLSVCVNQRVSIGQQTSSQVQTMIRACAAVPSLRLHQTNTLSKAMKLDNAKGNRWITNCSVGITNNLAFSARVLPAPAIEYGVNGWIKPDEKYLIPAICKNWYAAALMGPREGRMNENLFRNYIRIFLQHCREHGMEMGDPLGCEYIRRAKQQDVEPLIAKAKSLGATFIHFVLADELNYHAHIKYIESQEQIVTQDLKATTALAVTLQHKRQTLDNIVNKTNIKMGGLNYSVHLETNCDQWITKPQFLIVGLDIAHPAISMVSKRDQNIVPSVVGVIFSKHKKHPLDFIGGYRYAKAQMEELVDDTIQQIFSDLLRYFNANRGKPPMHLFIIRDGVSIGQYKYVGFIFSIIMNIEVEQIKKACQMVGGPGFRPHITFIVLTKMHGLRIYKKNINKQEGSAKQNIKPGTIIDKYVVNPVINEFYLNSHSTFQGTTKIPRYTLLFDTSEMKADVMQGIVHALAFDFQIVNMAVSRPSPVMIASRMAKRGRCNYVAMYGDEMENSDNGKGIEKDLVELNNKLSYVSKPLEAGVRIRIATVSMAIRRSRSHNLGIAQQKRLRYERRMADPERRHRPITPPRFYQAG
ncbi:hypothetical protein DINM_003826 [Dirofilaria immitis]|nr:hypothetical protein [Dirofilaria immitis]